jgi:hypothetical protein
VFLTAAAINFKRLARNFANNPRSPVRTRLPAGGRRIRTLGPAVKSTAVPRRPASFRARLNRLGAVPIPGGTESSNPLSSSEPEREQPQTEQQRWPCSP